MEKMREQIRLYFKMEMELNARRKQLEQQLDAMENELALQRAKGGIIND